MSKIPVRLRQGKDLEGEAGDLQDQLKDVYDNMAPAINRKSDMIINDTRDPDANDRNLDLGTLFLRPTAGKLWVLQSNNPVTWKVII